MSYQSTHSTSYSNGPSQGHSSNGYGHSSTHGNGYSNGHHSSHGHSSSSKDYSRSSSSGPTANPPADLEYHGTIDFEKYDDIPVETSGRDCPTPIAEWKDVDLGSIVQRNIDSSGYKKPTPVQKYSLPTVFAGRDMMGCAQTGSGKTAAFLLPIIAGMLRAGPPPPGSFGYQQKCYPTALVLAPTRELAVQINDEARKFSARSGLKSVVVYGGSPIGYQLREISRGVDILVATPGRLVDIIEKGSVSLARIRYLVLDEADRMLDMGFEPQIRKIVEQLDMPPKGQRQTLMFSATFPKEIQVLAASFLTDYVFLTVGRVGSTTELVKQNFVFTPTEDDKEKALLDLVNKSKGFLTLIFVETKKKAANLDYFLRRHNFPATSIHGDRSQQERTAALKSFSTGKSTFLIATNVAARGLDISNVRHVINFEMPTNIDDYVHRIGRTGRAGKEGVSTAFIGEKDVVIPDLIKSLRESGNEVPLWLQQLDTKSHKKGFYNKYSHGPHGGNKSHRFGGRDFRNDGHSSHSSHSAHSSHSHTSHSNYPSANTGGYSNNNNNYQSYYNPQSTAATTGTPATTTSNAYGASTYYSNPAMFNAMAAQYLSQYPAAAAAAVSAVATGTPAANYSSQIGPSLPPGFSKPETATYGPSSAAPSSADGRKRSYSPSRTDSQYSSSSSSRSSDYSDKKQRHDDRDHRHSSSSSHRHSSSRDYDRKDGDRDHRSSRDYSRDSGRDRRESSSGSKDYRSSRDYSSSRDSRDSGRDRRESSRERDRDHHSSSSSRDHHSSRDR